MKTIYRSILFFFFLATLNVGKSQNVGDTVVVKMEDGFGYPAVISQLAGNVVKVKTFSGAELSKPSEEVSVLNWKRGSRISCDWKGEGKYFWGMISKTLPNGTFWMVYDDGDIEKIEYSRCRCEIEP